MKNAFLDLASKQATQMIDLTSPPAPFCTCVRICSSTSADMSSERDLLSLFGDQDCDAFMTALALLQSSDPLDMEPDMDSHDALLSEALVTSLSPALDLGDTRPILGVAIRRQAVLKDARSDNESPSPVARCVSKDKSEGASEIERMRDNYMPRFTGMRMFCEFHAKFDLTSGRR